MMASMSKRTDPATRRAAGMAIVTVPMNVPPTRRALRT
jgi:hypothetical protein